MKPDTPDLTLLERVVSARILEALRTMAAEYERLGIRHALAGGLAVGAQGWPRATRDVDFLVDESAFEHRAGGLVLLRVPFQVHGVPADSLAPGEDEPFLAEARDRALRTCGIPVLPVEALVYMKLKAWRMQDRADVVGLLKHGTDPELCRAWLAAHAPQLLDRFDSLVEQARVEQAAE